MPKNFFMVRSHFRSEHLRICLPNQQVGFNIDEAIHCAFGRGQSHEIIARFPPDLSAVRIHRSRTEAYEFRVARNSVAVFMPEKLNGCPSPDGVFDIIVIHKPVWWVMAHDHVYVAI